MSKEIFDIFALINDEDKEALFEQYGKKIQDSYNQSVDLFSKGDYKKAADAFKKLVKDNSQEKLFVLGMIASLIATADNPDKVLEDHGEILKDGAEYPYLQGIIWEQKGYPRSAVNYYYQSVDINDEFVPALFRIAYYCDLYGDDDSAVKLYEKCIRLQPLHVNILMNLGLIYEDNNEYEKAIKCYSKITVKYPEHQRAKLYLDDAIASLTMYVDEEKERLQDKHNQILATPISEFELSVRSRNCLNKMKIKTLGSLVKKSESELLSYKNFGETSLAEIKEILNKKGLSLGMGKEDFEAKKKEKRNVKTTAKMPKNKEILSASVTEMELSVRSRKCLINVGVKTIGDLVSKSELELLSCKNFGQTSMTEIKRKLSEMGLSLAT